MGVQNRDETEEKCQVGKDRMVLGDTRNTFVMFLRLQVFVFWLKKSRFLIEIGVKMLQAQYRIRGTKLRLYLTVLRHSVYVVCVWGRTSRKF